MKSHICFSSRQFWTGKLLVYLSSYRIYSTVFNYTVSPWQHFDGNLWPFTVLASSSSINTHTSKTLNKLQSICADLVPFFPPADTHQRWWVDIKRPSTSNNFVVPSRAKKTNLLFFSLFIPYIKKSLLLSVPTKIPFVCFVLSSRLLIN